MKASQLQETVQAEATNWFHSLEPVVPHDMVGLWKGDGHPSGHPLDGVLENLHWFGKRFHPDMRADALLFEGEPGRLIPVDPKFFPIRLANRFAVFGRSALGWNLFQHIRSRVRATGTTATLQMRMDHNVMTAAMGYDRQPITDYFRRIDGNQVAGMMVVERPETVLLQTYQSGSPRVPVKEPILKTPDGRYIIVRGRLWRRRTRVCPRKSGNVSYWS